MWALSSFNGLMATARTNYPMAYRATTFNGTPVEYTLVNDSTLAIAQFHYQGTLFRILPMFPGYAFAADGKALSFKRRKPRYLKPGTSAAGRYWFVNVGQGALSRSQLLHRLVGFAFIPNETPLLRTQINHIDGNPANNAASNLEWVTPAENVQHANALRETEYRDRIVLTETQKLMIKTLYASGMTIPLIVTLLKLPYDSVRRHATLAPQMAAEGNAA